MNEIIAIAIGFACMPLLMRIKKLNFGLLLLIVGTLIGVIAGMAPSAMFTAAIQVFTIPSNLNTILTVIVIGMLGYLLNYYGILAKIVTALQQIIHNPKIILMILPPIMGMLPVPGGAYLSAPFIDTIGKDLGINPGRRATINLTFRHMSMFLLPFGSTMLIIASTFPQISIYHVIALNVPFVICFGAAAYFFYMRGVKYEKKAGLKITSTAIGQLLLYSLPIYAIVIINALFGVPMWVASLASLVITFFICDKKNYLKTLVAGINVKTGLMLVGVFFIQNIVRAQTNAIAICGELFVNSSGFVALCVIAAVALILGLTTGMSLVSLSIMLPLIASLPITPMAMLIYIFFTYCWAFIGYYYSPMHLCQILTNEAIGCTLGETSKENLKIAPILAIASFVLYYAYSFIF